MKSRTTLALAAMLCSGAVSHAAWVNLDMTSVFDYDIVATAAEDAATGTTKIAYSALGDHNGNRAASWQTPIAYTNQASAPGGTTAWPDDGVIASGKYRLATVFDNGTDYLTPVDNAISLQSNFGDSVNQKTRTLVLAPAEQQQYTAINMVFTAYKQSNHSSGFRSWIEVEYTDGSIEMIADTGNQTGDGGTFGGAIALGGGIAATSDTYSFTNVAPNYPGTIGTAVAHAMTARAASAAIAAGDATLWQFDTDLAVDSTKTLKSITVGHKAPPDSANRDGSLFVMAISANPIPEPTMLAPLTLAGLLLFRRGRQRA